MSNEVVLQASELHATGLAYADLARMSEKREIHRVRRGSYLRYEPTTAEQRHRALIEGSLAVLDPGSVVSHVSAAVLWGLPTWNRDLSRVHVVRARNFGGRLGSVVHLHPAVVPSDEITVVEGVPVTSLARTVADCARTLPFAYGVAVGDVALRLGMSREDLQLVLWRKPRRVGNPTARRVLAFIDERAESVDESVSRVRMAEEGLPEPELQVEIVDPRTGEIVARCDFGWRDKKTVGEYDGMIKYGRLLKPGQSAGDVVVREKVREDVVRDLGYSMVRWMHVDLSRFRPVADRLRRAFNRAS